MQAVARRIETSPAASRLRVLLAASVLAMLLAGALASQANATGWGGWSAVGGASLNNTVSALHATPEGLYAGGSFVDAAGNPNADRIARWDGSQWSAISSRTSQIANGIVEAIATYGDLIFAGGTFDNAGGNVDADRLAVWDGTRWAPFCKFASSGSLGSVKALQVIGGTLYVGGTFADGAGIKAADGLIACDIPTGTGRATTPVRPFSGPVYALAADGNGTLYAGGGFSDLENIASADNVAAYARGRWRGLPPRAGTRACRCAVDGYVRSLTARGKDLYVGTDAKNIDGIAEADNVVRFDGTWSAVGESTSGLDGWFPASTSINALTTFDSMVYAAGSFQNANGDPLADQIAAFDGSAWHPVGSNGAGNGPWVGNGLALAMYRRAGGPEPMLFAAGNFTSAGGDPLARFVASFDPWSP